MSDLAESLIAVDRGAEALSLIDECIQLAAGKSVEPDLLMRAFDVRLRHFEKTKDAAACRRTAAMWEKLKPTDGDGLYAAACFRAVLAAVLRAADKSASATNEADAEADRAMAWLKQAVAAGYKNIAWMKKDKELDSLRARDDFKKLVAELERMNEGQKSKP
jgi:hypothetical protein